MNAEETMDLCAFDKLFKRNVPHILEKIFFSLDIDTFLICLKVNKGWKELLTSEAFKKKGKTVYYKEICGKVYIAAYDGNDENVKTLFTTGMVDVNHEWVAKSLYVAARKGHTKVVHLLLKEGADPGIADADGMTPLMSAAQRGYNVIVQMLLNKGADPNKEDIYHIFGSTAPHCIRSVYSQAS